jgi:hypothetical protein
LRSGWVRDAQRVRRNHRLTASEVVVCPEEGTEKSDGGDHMAGGSDPGGAIPDRGKGKVRFS